MKELLNKNILFIAPRFRGYEERICAALRQEGANVTFEPERKYDFFHRLYRIQYLRKIYQKRHFIHITQKTDWSKIDILFVIRGWGMPTFFLENIKKYFPQIKMIMYQWDSEQANPYIHLRNYFDKLLTFDPADAKKFNLPYLPLFHSFLDAESEKMEQSLSIDYLFVCSYRDERYLFFKQIMPKLKGLKFAYYIYLPLLEFIMLYIRGRSPSWKDIHIFPLDYQKYLQLLKKSKCVIDFTPSIQKGLPIRFAEAIAAGKKIVTTNSYALEEFENHPNIKLYSNDFDFVSFLQTPPVSCEKYALKYSIQHWLHAIFQNIDNG